MCFALERFFAGRPEVEAAWLLDVKGEEEEEFHRLLMIEFHGARTQMFPATARIMKQYMRAGEKFELMERVSGFDAEKLATAKVYTRKQGSLN